MFTLVCYQINTNTIPKYAVCVLFYKSPNNLKHFDLFSLNCIHVFVSPLLEGRSRVVLFHTVFYIPRPKVPTENMLFSHLFGRLKAIVLAVLAIFNRALCCFSRKRRNSYSDDSEVLQMVSVVNQSGSAGGAGRKAGEVYISYCIYWKWIGF